jgi:hypothetical protein
MKKLFLLLLLIIYLPGSSQNVFKITPGTFLKTGGGVFIVSENTSLINDGNLQQASGDGSFKFTGNADASVSGLNIPTFARLIVSKTGTAKLQLQQHISVIEELIFDDGLLDLNNFHIDLGTTGMLSGENETTHAIGPNGGYIQIINTLNAPSSVNPGNLGAIFTSAQNLGSTIIRRGHQSQSIAGAGGSSILRYYDISPVNNTGLNGTLRFSYLDAELNSLDENNFVFWRSTDNINWTEEGYTSRNTTTNYVEKTTIDAFSRWTLSSVSNPLPVVFLLFNARCENGKVFLTWKTAQEFNGSQFDIERTIDGNNWTVIGSLHATGNSNTERSYSFSDNAPSPAAIYRIAEYDIDRRVKYTSIIRSDCDAKDNWKIWPNPVSENLWININTAAASKIIIKIFDSKGALISSQQNNLLRGNNLLNVDMEKIAAGTYHVLVNWDNGQIQKVVKIVKK